MTKRRSRKRKRKTKPPGLPPGTLVVDPESPPPVIHAIAYDADNIVEMAITEPETLTELMTRWPVTWINVNGLGDVAMVERLGQVFGLHRLALEDILNVTQRAKLEEYAGGYFIIAHMIRLPEHLATEQISLFVGRNFVLTFQETAGDCLDGVRDRLRHARGRVRGEGADYLAYVILDSVTDNYFPVVETFAERLDTLEEAVFTARENDIVERIHEIKTELQHLRRQLFPQQQVLSMLAKDELQLIRPETRLFFRDVQDHTVQAIELIDSHRETATGLVDAYLSMVSRKMNDVMKVLTIIATIFIPLSFIAGLYGMNFDTNRSPWNMPELRWTFGYPFALGLMASVAAGLIFFSAGADGSETAGGTAEATYRRGRIGLGVRKTLLIVIVLMAGIATAEVALTLGRYGDSAPGLLPDGTPTRGHSYETRNPYVNRTFSDATINIVVFGGAWVFGLGCDTDETFSAILEKSFAANDPPVRVVNLGQPDFTSAEVAKTFPRMLARYKADAAVVMTGLTDAVPLLLKDDYFARRPFTIAERGSLDVVRLVRLYGTLRFAAMVHGGGFKRASETTFKARYFPMEKTQDNLLEIGKRAARLRVPVVYVTFPRNEASSWLHPHYPIYNERNLLIRTTAYNYNAKLLDLEALMHPLKTPEYLLPWMRWPHPNAAGHAYIADNLRTELIAAVPGLNL